jgi:DUF1707 SHOCT-like domain
MTAGPGDEKAAGTTGRGHLKASHADRDNVIEVLTAAFAQGRIAKDEFDLRLFFRVWAWGPGIVGPSG